jgi:6-phosphofructokinase 1
VGAPAGGLNAATRAAVRYCVRQGHTPLAIHNGFRGLLDDNVQELSWLGVDNWTARGGSELGTNRTLPDTALGTVAAKFQEHHFHALLLIGGFEAFHSLLILEKARALYPAFHIPMVHLPATLSNNIPLTDFSLGSDTSLNALVDACDAIKQSAAASRSRVFVIETQGGNSGYLAVMGALAVGACVVYTPEIGINLDMLREDVRFMRSRFAHDEKGKLEGRLIVKYVTLLVLGIHVHACDHPSPQERKCFQCLLVGCDHEDVQRRRRDAFRCPLGLTRAHAARRDSVTDGSSTCRATLTEMHSVY